MALEIAGHTYVQSMLRGKTVNIVATDYNQSMTYKGVVTTFATGLTESILIVLDEKTIINSKYIISIDILD